MRNLFSFIFRYHFFFLFLIFEFFSIYLLVQNNYYPQAKIFNVSKEIEGDFHKKQTNITQYFNLTKSNKELSELNAKLLNLSIKNFSLIDTSTYLIDNALYKYKYYYTSARVIKNSINKRNNYITLNKGKNFGIGKDMAVICPKGIVGIVKNVSYNYASVISILNSKSKISAKIKKNNYIGTLVWEGSNYRQGILADIPSNANILRGDTIITSGYSNIFPEGLPIATIAYYKKEKGGNFFKIYVDYLNNFNNLDYVYVIKNIEKTEQDKLEAETQND